jgi:HemY protein
VAITWMGYEVRVHLGILAGALVFLLFLLWPLLSLLRTLLGLPSAWRARRHEERHAQGMSALTKAFTALAISDLKTAGEQTRLAREMLGEGALISLLSAQTAYRQEDLPATQRHLDEMLAHKETRFIASRALASLAREEGRMDEAITHARRAVEEHPKNLAAYRALTDLYLQAQRWQEAQNLIRNARHRRRVADPEAARILAILQYTQAVRFQEERNSELARHLAREAFRLDASFTPAAALHAILEGKSGNRRRAFAALSRAYRAQPHPDITDALLEVFGEEPELRLTRRVQALVKHHPEHPESTLMHAEAAMHLAAWNVARDYLKPLIQQAARARPYRLMAEIETRQYRDHQAASEWNARIPAAARDPSWVCASCGEAHARWALRCASCQGFDTLRWQLPGAHADPHRSVSRLLAWE